MANVSPAGTDRQVFPVTWEEFVKTNPTPGKIMLIAGGAVLLISTFFAWVSIEAFGEDFTESGLSTDGGPGLLGIWCLLIGGGIAVLTALQTFAGTNLPSRVLGFSWNQIFLMLGFAAFLITFGRQFADSVGFGVTLGWIASAVIVAGAFMELQAETRTTNTSVPRQF
jgi:hypothetical protein